MTELVRGGAVDARAGGGREPQLDRRGRSVPAVCAGLRAKVPAEGPGESHFA